MAENLYDIIGKIKIPRMIRVRQKFDAVEITDIEQAVRREMQQKDIDDTIQSGMRIAIAVGSRGICHHKDIVKTVVSVLKEKKAFPFIVPAMGSHGGATAKGQAEILASAQIVENYVGCPIVSSMETVKVGETNEGHSVHIDKRAYEADGIILIGKIKPHTAFRGSYESGMMKMMTIGLGKQYGASICHQAGFKNMAHLVPLFGNVILKQCNILFGLSVIENAYGRSFMVKALTGDKIPDEEPKLLEIARTKMGSILFNNIAVLAIDEIGKNYSGDGQDPNVTGRFITPYAANDVQIQKICVLDLSEETRGIMVGIGCVDVCTSRVLQQARLEESYINAITSTVFTGIHLPMMLKNDYFAIAACIKTCNEVDIDNIRMVRIPNTLEIGEIYISESMLEDAASNPCIEILGSPEEMEFDNSGNLIKKEAFWSH